ncbi:Wzt carbohydrate-binding domain-containing protein [bacterium]|nr:Wzt carbohydrate-binding domain-containing protein [bacterium]
MIRNLTKDYHIYSRRGQKFKEVLAFGTKDFHDRKRALYDVTLDIARGECLGVIGDNGSGKSTLLKILAGTTYATAGEVSVQGVVSYILDPSTGFNRDLSGHENIRTKCGLLGVPPAHIKELYPKIIEFSGLGDRIWHPYKTYSAGMQVRLGFSIAVHVPFDVLIVDEVLSVGDFLFQRKCVKAIREFRKLNKTIIVTSHSLSEVSSYCDRLLLLRDGNMMALGGTESVIKEYMEACERAWNVIESPMLDDKVLNPSTDRVEGANITGITVLGTDGKDHEEYETGEPIEVRLQVNTHGTLVDPCYRVQFVRNDGLVVSGMNNHRLNIRFPSVAGPHEVVFRFPKLNLLAGDYYLNVGVWPDEYQSWVSRTPYDIHEFKRVVRVRQDRRHGGGLVHNPCEIRLTKP